MECTPQPVTNKKRQTLCYLCALKKINCKLLAKWALEMNEVLSTAPKPIWKRTTVAGALPLTMFIITLIILKQSLEMSLQIWRHC